MFAGAITMSILFSGTFQSVSIIWDREFGFLIGLGQTAALLALVSLLSLAFTALGVVIATRMETFEGFGVISNFVVLPLYFLSGGVFPVDRVPRWMSALIHVNLATYGVDLLRHAMGQPVAFGLALDLAVVAAFGGAMVGAALLWFRRE